MPPPPPDRRQYDNIIRSGTPSRTTALRTIYPDLVGSPLFTQRPPPQPAVDLMGMAGMGVGAFAPSPQPPPPPQPAAAAAAPPQADVFAAAASPYSYGKFETDYLVGAAGGGLSGLPQLHPGHHPHHQDWMNRFQGLSLGS